MMTIDKRAYRIDVRQILTIANDCLASLVGFNSANCGFYGGIYAQNILYAHALELFFKVLIYCENDWSENEFLAVVKSHNILNLTKHCPDSCVALGIQNIATGSSQCDHFYMVLMNDGSKFSVPDSISSRYSTLFDEANSHKGKSLYEPLEEIQINFLKNLGKLSKDCFEK